MTTVIAVRGGIAEVEVGHAVIIDCDDIVEDPAAAEDALVRLKGVRGVGHLRSWIREVWPDVRV